MTVRCLKSAAKLMCFAATMIVVSLSSAQACSRGGLPAAALQVVPTENADQALFNRAVLSEVNYVRCKAGLAPLKTANGLVTVAGNHANWMAAKQSLTHRSTVRGQASVRERVLASGLSVRRGAENIGNLPRYQFAASRRIRIKNKSRCEFTTVAGKRITPHSYASLASEIVGLWMGSAGHRRNVLDRNVRTVGAAVGYDARGTRCGQFYMAQDFAG